MADNKKSFTADEVNKIVTERLLRQKKNDDALIKLKEMLLALKEEGKLRSASVAELANELADAAASFEEPQKAEEAEIPEKAAEEVVEEAAEETTEETAEEAAEETAEETAQVALKEKFAAEIAELSDAYPELDVNGLINDEEFEKFYSSLTKDVPDATLLSAYEAYSEAKAIEKRIRAASSMKRTPATQSAGRDAGQDLTERQRNIARHAGMSYKEYAELLSEIPKRKLR